MSDKKSITSKELQGVSQLVEDTTAGITDLVEAMFQRILYPPFIPKTPVQHLISGISTLTFKSIKLITKSVGSGLGFSFSQLDTQLAQVPAKEKEAILSALNGIVGDYLVSKQNTLAITMQFKYQHQSIQLNKAGIQAAYPTANSRILIMIHGLCMNDRQWERNEHNHGKKLAEELNFSPIYLHYNTGQHISTNGQQFSQLLEQLMHNWPVPVEEINIVAHSMGGLVGRSAIYYGQQEDKIWLKHLKKVVFLGTPHHGAPLEQAGNYLDIILEAAPYSKPFARLGKIRSAGITDLRHGNLLDTDWDNNSSEALSDHRTSVPLPQQIDFYSIAATITKEGEPLANALIGDGLVPIKSALGNHDDANKTLQFSKTATHIVYEHNHMDVLDSQQVYSTIKRWLSC